MSARRLPSERDVREQEGQQDGSVRRADCRVGAPAALSEGGVYLRPRRSSSCLTAGSPAHGWRMRRTVSARRVASRIQSAPRSAEPRREGWSRRVPGPSYGLGGFGLGVTGGYSPTGETGSPSREASRALRGASLQLGAGVVVERSLATLVDPSLSILRKVRDRVDVSRQSRRTEWRRSAPLDVEIAPRVLPIDR
jgi:hypothetical protein